MKKIYSPLFLSCFFIFTCCFCLRCFHSSAQAGMWTWMHGNNFPGSSGVFGTQGVADPANYPPGLYEAFSWTDKNNNLWLFGGLLIGHVYSALWKYDISSNTWTWVKGPNAYDQTGVYGTQGVPSPTNLPGARSYGGYNWVDTSGCLWLYGGWGYGVGGFGLMSDLWKYDPATNEWTWVSGNSVVSLLPSYDTFQVPSSTAHPGGRAEVGASWVDNNNRLWLYGGQGYFGSYGDVWYYDPATNEWAWMNGANTVDPPPNYGTLGVFDPSNTPGGRWVYTGWNDESGNGWIFGGIASFSFGLSADMWKYDVATNQWAWMSGSPIAGDTGVHGLECETSANYYPSGRGENRACGVDKCGNFWMYSGSSANLAPDLWLYDIINNEWTFLKGNFVQGQLPVYGVQGTPSATNSPGFRVGAVSWTDASGNFWVMGGNTFAGSSNDLWQFVPDPSCTPAISCYGASVGFVASDADLCEKFCTDFFDQSLNNPTSWQWFFDGGIPSVSIYQNPANICYDVPGSYDVTLITTSPGGNDTLVLVDYITVYPTPPIPSITQIGNILTSSPAATYQWQFNSVDIPGATNQSYTATQTGFYSVIIADSNSCQNSSTLYVEFTGIEDLISNMNLIIYPNPATGNIMVEWLNGQMANEVFVRITNTLGQEVFYLEEPISSLQWKKEIDVSPLTPGLYFIQLRSGNGLAGKNIIVIN